MNSSSDNKVATYALMDKIGFDRQRYRLGHTIVFFRAGALAGLEETRDELVRCLVEQIMMITLSHIIIKGDQIGEDAARRSSEEDPRRCVQEEVRPEGADQGRPEIMISLIFLILFSIV